MKKVYLILSLLLTGTTMVHAQNWMSDMRDPHVNFYTVQSEFNAWWAIHGPQIMQANKNAGKNEKEGAWQLYKNWEHTMLPLMTATGGVRLGAPSVAEKNFYSQRQARQGLRTGGTWTYIGAPISFDDGGGDSSCGRVNCVRFDPINPNVIYCGAPSGGLWKSSDFGHSWAMLNTDNLAQIGVSDIAINPQNPNTIYIATGDIANSACLSIGVLKSMDGGQTWDTTGLNWTVTQGLLIGRLLMSPLDSNTMFAATSTGIFKTIDGGLTWQDVDPTATGLTGMEFNPGNPNTIYACGSEFYKSVDNGTTWHVAGTGVPPPSDNNGLAIGVTAADTTCVYVLASATSTSSGSYFNFDGLYRSLDAGNTFAIQSSNPDPSSTGTQGAYDLNVAVSTVNKDLLVVGAVNSSFSNDGGQTWNNGSFASHVDHHDIRFFHNSIDTVFSADDGGLFLSTDGGNTWAGLNNGMHIGQIYNISSSSQTKYLYLSGRQDEGTLYQDTSYELLVSGGDGLECLIDPANQNDMFGSSEEGVIGNSNNGGASISNLIAADWGTGVNGPGAWNTPYALGPHNSQTIYIAKDYIYESNDGGNSFNQLNSPDLASSGYYQLLAIAPSDTNYIYAAGYNHLFMSSDAGNTFTNITGSLAGYITALAISPYNPNEIWVGFSGSSPGSRVLCKSTDGGATYTSFDTGLPIGTPFYALSIAPVRNSKDALYTSLSQGGGVYYRDSTMSSWIPYSSGLPNVSVDQLEIDYCANKVRAATYGRDLWESDPYVPLAVPPTAMAGYNVNGSPCPSRNISFTDNSNFAPTSWQWYFPGGQPASSTAQNPTVSYPNNGTLYTVTFIATNANGSDTVYYNIQSSVCVGINEVSANNTISIYPNPNKGNFVLSVTGGARGQVDIALTDDIGQSVYTNSYIKDADALTAECSLPYLADGVYYLRVTADGINSVQKLVISGQGR